MSELNSVIPMTGYQTAKIDKPMTSVSQVMDSLTQNIRGEKKFTDEYTETATPLSAEEIAKTVQEMNDFLHDMKRNLSFSIDDELGKSVIIVKDSDSDEVIRQIPSEELVVLRKKMDDVAGILFDTKV
ncbi:flagellar protein FlaG [Psychromonas sp. GE-S-Ul-11]|uniref:flagellar protein FlaG n=1 Tax=Psychromonas sp. GE-S-Ul-11 TaxID=3241170 RepID=UPI00390CBA67